MLVLPRLVRSCRSKSRLVTSRWSCLNVSGRILSRRIVSCPVGPVPSCLDPSCQIGSSWSGLVIARPVLSGRVGQVMSHHVKSDRVSLVQSSRITSRRAISSRVGLVMSRRVVSRQIGACPVESGLVGPVSSSHI